MHTLKSLLWSGLIYITVSTLIPVISVHAQIPTALTLVDSMHLPIAVSGSDSTGGSDVWGWTAPDETEYAFMGYVNGTAVIRTTPVLEIVDTIPGPRLNDFYYHRDYEVYQNYLYIVHENTGNNAGMSVVDLSYLPDSVHLVGVFNTNNMGQTRSHNIFIDTTKGFAYLEGSFSNQVHIHDLSNPENPVYLNSFGTAGSSIHDGWADNDTVYLAEGSSGTWSVWDLSNKLSPSMIVRVSPPAAGYVHNIWLSPDRQYCATTEETGFKTVKIWDISNFASIALVGEYLGSSNLAHDVRWMGDIIVMSHYEAGVTVIDVSDPTSPIEVAQYDTYPLSDAIAFHATWGVFPYTKNNTVYASDLEGFFWVLQLEYEFACPIVVTGDTNGDELLTAVDIIGTVNFVFKSGPAPQPCQAASDSNCDGVVTAADVVYLVNHVFKSGAPPCDVCSLIPDPWLCP